MALVAGTRRWCDRGMDDLEQIGVWLTDGHPIFLCGLAGSLRGVGVRVSGESYVVPEALDADATDVLVYDAEQTGAVAAAARFRDDVGLVGVVRDARSERVVEVLAGGGAGVLVRSDLTPLALVACLRSVVLGQGAVPTEVLMRMLHARERGGDGELAGRELEVLRLLAGGRTTRSIALELCYSERTVKNVVRDLMLKLECRTRAQAVATATRQGLI